MGDPAQSTRQATPLAYTRLERALVRTIDRLERQARTPAVRAMLIEALRLRSVVGNWCSIPPTAAAYDEMHERVLELATALDPGRPSNDDEDDDAGDDFEPVDANELLGDIPPDDDEVFQLDLEPSSYALEGPSLLASPPVAYIGRAPAPLPPEGAPVALEQRATEGAPTTERVPERRDQPFSRGVNVVSERTSSPHIEVVAAPQAMPANDAPQPAPAPAPATPAVTPFPELDVQPPRLVEDAHTPPPSLNVPAPIPSGSLHSARPEAQSAAPEPAEAFALPPASERVAPPPSTRAAQAPATVRMPSARSQPDAPPSTRAGAFPDAAASPAPVNVFPSSLPATIDPHLVLLSDTYSERADAYRTLRRKLAAAGNPRVVAVTSPNASEGKTTCAINLALALLEGGRGKILLVEANLRAPRIATLLGFDPPECFSEQMRRHHDELRAWSVAEPVAKLHVLAVDPKATHTPFLDPVGFSTAMERLKLLGYDYIVVDTPPVIGSVDVNMIADTVDGVLFTAIILKSKKGPLKKAIEQVMPATILGVVTLDV